MESGEEVKIIGKIGWIGLGRMGSRIATRLRNTGSALIVYDRDPSKVDQLAAQGAEVAPSAAELAAAADIVFSCLPDGAAVRSVYFRTDGVLSGARPGIRIVEMSTVAPETTRHLFNAGREREIQVLDVAMSGSTPAAESGSLMLFGGGDREAFDIVAPIFPAIARQWFYMGPSGSGVSMKLVVNALLGVGMQAIALGMQLDLPRDLLFETLGKTAVVAPGHLGKLATAKQNDLGHSFRCASCRRILVSFFGRPTSWACQCPQRLQRRKAMCWKRTPTVRRISRQSSG